MTGDVQAQTKAPIESTSVTPQDIRLSYLRRRLALENAIVQNPAQTKDLLTSYLEDLDHCEKYLISNGRGSAILNAVEKSEIDKNRRLAQARQGILPKTHKATPAVAPATEVPWYDNTATLPEIVIKSGRLLAGHDDQLKAHKTALIDTPLKEAQQILSEREAAGSGNTEHLKTFIRQMSPLAERATQRLAPVSVTEITHEEAAVHMTERAPKPSVQTERTAEVAIDIIRMGYDARRAQFNTQMGKAGFSQALENYLADLKDRRKTLFEKMETAAGKTNPVHAAEMRIIESDTATANERRNLIYGRPTHATPTEERILKMLRSGLVLTDNIVNNGEDYPVLTEIVPPHKVAAGAAARQHTIPEGFPATIDEVVIVTPPAGWSEEDHRAFDAPTSTGFGNRHDRWSAKSLRDERDEITSELAKAKSGQDRLLILTELVNPLHQNVVAALQKNIAGKSRDSLSAAERATADSMLDHAFFLRKTSTALKEELLAAPTLAQQEIKKTEAAPKAAAEGFFTRLKALGQSAADLARGLVETTVHNARRLTVGALATGATAAAVFMITPNAPHNEIGPSISPVGISNAAAFNNAAQQSSGFMVVTAKVAKEENATITPIADAEEAPTRPAAAPKTISHRPHRENRAPALISTGFNGEATNHTEPAQEQTFDIATARSDLATLDRACGQIRANYDVDESHICAGLALK